MTIPLLGDEGLFTRLGRHGKIFRVVNDYQLNLLPPVFESFMLQHDAETIRDVASAVPPLRDQARQAAGDAPAGTLRGVAADTLNRMVFLDNKQFSREDVVLSLTELIRQMKLVGQTVQACTVTAAVAPFGTVAGDGFTVISTKRGDGLVQENLFAEIAYLTCTTDAQSGGAAAGGESFDFTGDVAQPDPFHWEWPLGSGATATVQAASPARDNAEGNLLVNGDFEDQTANVPAQWAVAVGTAGTDVVTETTNVYDGTKAVRLNPGAALTELSQAFNDAEAGTAAVLAPLTQYAVNVLVRPAAAATGTLSVALVDGAGAVVNDETGAANSVTKDLATLPAGAWSALSGVFRLPRVLPPTGVKLRLKLTAALSGAALAVDHVALAETTELYPGGPGLALFAGKVPWVKGDRYTVTTTNDRGGAALNGTFQTLFDRLFDTRAAGLLLPSAASPTIPDTLITS
jgi:hypothetical protein